jgi:Fe-Mn family superoxide dismutase
MSLVFELPDLPYNYKALEPYIDEETMRLHHDKHHAGYVNNLNKALKGQDNLLSKSLDKLLGEINKVPEEIRQRIINHGGGHANHSMFWTIMAPKVKEKPDGDFGDALKSAFGDLKSFREKFTDKAISVFGSGWAFLVVNSKGKLELTRHSFQNSPLMSGNKPILGLDVWEHAYYLKYQNRRAEYVDAWWNVVNWEQVQINFNDAIK